MSNWVYGTILALMICGCVLLVIMMATGYFPTEGFGHNPSHAARFGLCAGVVGGLGIGLGIMGIGISQVTA